ncbi:TIGR01244 family phosphatase [Jannaschia sp. Os4]|uniref:TIGR01244 family sulfur transferase n=1 Tax=Jannaschia sp. Os4 TaxID=2807617 RepID=UPI0019397A75|nr:TIGR01244 family sulfur transferase [Jannaschia sp. Os4]MBM2577686.1 TIGR01244 family phosphatase [Jannaschia sp. Os4]
MDLRPLDEITSVAPMIDPADVAALAEGGITTLICNRPDAEVPPSHQAEAMRQAAEAAGLEFVYNPLAMPNLTMAAIDEQADAIDGAEGRVLAYCASGTRSSVLWALAMAGRLRTDEIMEALEGAGYHLPQLRGQVDMLAKEREG